jgi:hypothetical protein
MNGEQKLFFGGQEFIAFVSVMYHLSPEQYDLADLSLLESPVRVISSQYQCLLDLEAFCTMQDGEKWTNLEPGELFQEHQMNRNAFEKHSYSA